MREKELRVALVCYGGVSLAVYMHGITKEIWRLARASQNVHSSTMRAEEEGETEAVYAHLLRRIALETKTDIRILVDILSGASAGGINAVFLGHAMATGEALDPLTDLWLDSADVDSLIDHADEHPDVELFFMPAAAGLTATLLRMPLLKRLARRSAPIFVRQNTSTGPIAS